MKRLQRRNRKKLIKVVQLHLSAIRFVRLVNGLGQPLMTLIMFTSILGIGFSIMQVKMKVLSTLQVRELLVVFIISVDFCV